VCHRRDDRLSQVSNGKVVEFWQSTTSILNTWQLQGSYFVPSRTVNYGNRQKAVIHSAAGALQARGHSVITAQLQKHIIQGSGQL
jgi:hypothetical protein